MPRPEDQLIIVTDACINNAGIGAILYVQRDSSLKLSGFFNAKLKEHQLRWLPCEVEAVAIGAAVKHFSPYIIQSSKTTQVLSDSRPCVQAYEKLLKGQFSTSARVSTFITVLSRYQCQLQHIAGSSNRVCLFMPP